MSNACISNEAYVTAASDQADAIVNEAIAEAAITTVLALWQRNSSKSMANMQNEIAQRQIELAEKVHNHAMKFWPEEKEYVDDAFGVSKHQPNYQALASGWDEFTENSMQDGRQDWIDKMREWCMPPSRCQDARWGRFAGLMRADTMSFAVTQEENRTDALNDIRYDKQKAALALGKGILKDVVSYANASGQQGLSAAGALGGLINAAAGALGFAFAYRSPQPWTIGGDWGQPVAHAPGYETNEVKHQPVPVPQAPAPRTPVDPCGPEPNPDTDGWEAWQRWYACKGLK